MSKTLRCLITVLVFYSIICAMSPVNAEEEEVPWVVEIESYFGLPQYWYEDLIQNEFTQAAIQKFDEICGDFDGKENIAISRITMYQTMDGQKDYHCVTIVFSYTHYELADLVMQYSFSERKITEHGNETVFLNMIRQINESSIQWSAIEQLAWDDFMSYIKEKEEQSPHDFDRYRTIFGESSLYDRGMYTIDVEFLPLTNAWLVTYCHKTVFPGGNQSEYVWYECKIDAQTGKLRRINSAMFPDIFSTPLYPFCK